MAMQCSLALAERVRNGDVDAFATIFDEYHQRICRYLCSLVRDPDLAEDLAQQTFVRAYRALSRAAPPQNLNAWLYAIATNSALSALRRQRLRAWLPFGLGGEPAAAEDHEKLWGEQELVGQAFSKLREDQVACLLLRFQHGLSYAELADALGTSLAATKMRLSRARAVFREVYLQLSEEAKR